MKNNKKFNEIVYFIGAGFSKILGYPIMNEFVDKYLTENLPTRSELIVEVIKKVTVSTDLEVILSALEKMIDTKYSFKLKEIIDYAQANMGKNENSSDSISSTMKIVSQEPNIINDLSETVSLIKKKIFQTYKPKRKSDYSKLDYFFAPIINFNGNHTGKISIPIFTTNYDNVIEDYFRSKKQEINIINGFNRNNIFDIKELEVSKFNNNIIISIFNLHGSYYFYEDQEVNSIKYL